MNSAHESALVSIAMPVRNCERTLACALRSIILQTYVNWELLLIDDGSSDDTIGVAQGFRDRRIALVHDGRHLGLPARLNQAIGLARGEFLARMDGDDVSLPERLAMQLRFLNAHSEIDLAGCGMFVFKGDGELLGQRLCGCTHEEICRRPWAQFPLGHPTWMGRAEWFRRHRYREDAFRMEDQELLLRAWQTSRFGGMPELLVGFREETISLRKLLAGRMNYCRALLREALASGDFRYPLLGAPAHMAKSTVDMLAVAARLNYRILRGRARPVTPETAGTWERFWITLRQQ